MFNSHCNVIFYQKLRMSLILKCILSFNFGRWKSFQIIIFYGSFCKKKKQRCTCLKQRKCSMKVVIKVRIHPIAESIIHFMHCLRTTNEERNRKKESVKCCIASSFGNGFFSFDLNNKTQQNQWNKQISSGSFSLISWKQNVGYREKWTERMNKKNKPQIHFQLNFSCYFCINSWQLVSNDMNLCMVSRYFFPLWKQWIVFIQCSSSWKRRTRHDYKAVEHLNLKRWSFWYCNEVSGSIITIRPTISIPI